MHTLFSKDILSPAPTPASQTNPFELLFPSSLSTASSAASTQSSPRQNDWLTQRIQNQQRAEADAVRQGSNASNGDRIQSGKSSIQKVVFQKLSPADTLFIEPTSRIETASMQSFITFESAELPASYATAAAAPAPDFDHHAIFSNAGAVIWVLDVQDEYLSSITSMIQTAVFLAEHYPRVNFEVFIHKIDGLSEEYKYETFREVRQRVQDELSDLDHGDRSVSYYQTSIFDHSVFEAMSKVVQRLLPQLPAMEALLNKLCSSCRIQKAYLFDTMSKIYVATDASPTFLRDYEVCSDYVDVIVDIKQIYGWHHRHSSQDPAADSRPASESGSSLDDGQGSGGAEIGESIVTYDRSGDTYIYAREINNHLSLLCVIGKGSSADKRVLIDYNVGILHDALLQVFRV
ncbi:ras-related GTP-binding protein-like protein C [Hortaea werneckii]|nr:ras-related GTP-binding protein-like protein C [Hortaea werneckii]